MPLPSDEQIVKTSHDLVAQLQAIFGKHPGFRPGCFPAGTQDRALLTDVYRSQPMLVA